MTPRELSLAANRYYLWTCVFALVMVVNCMLFLCNAHLLLKPQPHYIVHVNPERTAP